MPRHRYGKLTKLWLFNNKIVTDIQGRPLLCPVCPCGPETGTGTGTGSGTGGQAPVCLHDPITGDLKPGAPATLTMEFYLDEVFQCSETWTWDKNASPPGWYNPNAPFASTCSGHEYMHCQDLGQGDCSIFKLVDSVSNRSATACSDNPFAATFEYDFGFPTQQHYRIEFFE